MLGFSRTGALVRVGRAEIDESRPACFKLRLQAFGVSCVRHEFNLVAFDVYRALNGLELEVVFRRLDGEHRSLKLAKRMLTFDNADIAR